MWQVRDYSWVSAEERERRVALERLRRERTRRSVELAKAEEEVSESELEEARAASIAGSIGKLTDLESEGGCPHGLDLDQARRTWSRNERWKGC